MWSEKKKVIALAATCLVVGGYIVVRATLAQAPQGWPMLYWVDERTGEISIGATALPPNEGKVWGIFVSCDPTKDKQLAYLMKYDEKAKTTLMPARDAIPGFTPADLMAAYHGMLVRSPAPGSRWVPMHSREGLAVRTATACPAGVTMRLVWPNDGEVK